MYFFFARVDWTGPTGKAMVLYCLRSANDGLSFPTLTRVFMPPLPTAVFGTVPPNNSPGFFRIGRVWSCIAPNGRVHLVWMDNREGRVGDTGDDATRDKWRVRRAYSDDKGLTWTVPEAPVSDQPSIGGYGIPDPIGNESHIPPGDMIACDADDGFLYVAWTDTRNAPGTPQVYFRRYVDN